MDSEGDSSPFSLSQSLGDGGAYQTSSSTLTTQYHVWVAAAAAAAAATSTPGLSNATGGGNNTSELPGHFSPVSPSAHGSLYADHISLHASQSAVVDVLGVRLGQSDYHGGQSERLGQSDGYHSVGQSDSGRHAGSQSDYHDHLGGGGGGQQERHLGVEVYHHAPSSSSSTSSSSSSQGQERLMQADYGHSGQTSDRLGQAEYHVGQQPDRVVHGEYHAAQQPDRHGQMEYHVTQSDRLTGLGGTDYHSGGQAERLGGQQSSGYHAGQPTDRGLGGQADYHTGQVDLDVSMHTDFERRHLEASIVAKELVDSGQRNATVDYLSSHNSRELASLHRDIVGLQRELDLSVGQNVSPAQRATSADLPTSSYGLDPTTLPHDLTPYSQRDLDRAMTADVVGGQHADGAGRGGSSALCLHPQDLAVIGMGSARDLVDMASLVRSSGTREDPGHVRDVIHRPRDIQRALDALGPLATAGRTDINELAAAANSVTKGGSRTYSTSSRLLTPSSKRQGLVASQTADMRSVTSAPKNANTSVNFLSLGASRDALGMMAVSESSVGKCSSRMIPSSDFCRQQANATSRLRRELTAPYTELGVRRTVLGSAGVYKAVDTLFAPHESLVSADTLTSSRERLHEMMKQHQFCDAVMATNLHSIKVHKPIICSASPYLCGVLSQTNMGKRGGSTLTVQFKADIPAPSLNAFIDFIYLGRVPLTVKNARDLRVMARCLHMETLKKATEEVLWTAHLNNDTDLNIPELLLLEQHVDKRDQACSAHLPVPREAPPTHDVGVVTDACNATTCVSDAACQTNSCSPLLPATPSSGSSGERRSAPNALWVGGLGTLSLNAKGTLSVKASGKAGDSPAPVSIVPETTQVKSPFMVPTTSATSSTTTAAAPINPHHKKQLASEACRSRAAAESHLVSSRSAEGRSSVASAVQTEPNSWRTAGVKSRKKQAASLSVDRDMSYPSPLPGQTARAVHHSYGTRAAARTPAKDLVNVSPQLSTKESSKPSPSSLFKSKAEATDLSSCGQAQSEDDPAVQSQLMKHRGRTLKGRIAGVLSSQAFNTASASANVTPSASRFVPRPQERAEVRDEMAERQDAPETVPNPFSSAESSTAAVSASPVLATAPQHTTPKGYRKRLIQSVASESQRANQLLAEQAAAAAATATESGKCGGVRTADSSSAGKDSDKAESCERSAGRLVLSPGQTHDPARSHHAGEDGQHFGSSGPPAAAPKRRKKTKSSGGVRVRAPPKKRAKMELAELEKMMREETEEEDEEEDAATTDVPSVCEVTEQGGAHAKDVERQKHWELQAQQTASGRRTKMPFKQGRRARWIKNDRLTHLVIQLSARALELPEGDKRHYQCRLCNNEFLLPRRCISHVLVTHKIPEAEVLDNITVRRRDREDTDPTVCDICGYKSRDSHTYYLHYHKYFKHSVPLPKGWSVYKCDLCGKELFTKFQLKDHKRAHEEKTPFVCEVCGKGFQSRTCLHSHVFHRHNTEKKHSCDNCEKTFKTRTQLLMHTRTHTGERPFACPLCTYRSTTRGNMRMHFVNRHKMAPEVSRDIMQDLKPDTDPAAATSSQQQSKLAKPKRTSDVMSGEISGKSQETKGQTKVRRRRKKQETSGTRSTQLQQSALTGIVCLQDKPCPDVEPSAVEQFLKTATSGRVDDEDDLGLRVRMEEEGGFQGVEDPLASGAYMMLVPATSGADGDGYDDGKSENASSNVIALQATGGLPAAGLGLDVPGEVATTLALIPPGLESVFQPHPSGGLPAAATTATIIVPENLVHTFSQQQPHHHHQNFYGHLHPHYHHHHLNHHHQPPQQQQQHPFASFTVVGAATTVHPLTSHDLVVQATNLIPHSGKAEDVVGVDGGVVALGGVEVQVVDGAAVRPGELSLQQVVTSCGGVSSFVPQPVASSSDPHHSSPQVHLYMQHSPISPPAPLSPTPTYDAITPTPSAAAFKQESDSFHDQMTASAGVVALASDHSQAQQQQHYDTSLLQVYYQQQQQQQFYSQNY